MNPESESKVVVSWPHPMRTDLDSRKTRQLHRENVRRCLYCRDLRATSISGFLRSVVTDWPHSSQPLNCLNQKVTMQDVTPSRRVWRGPDQSRIVELELPTGRRVIRAFSSLGAKIDAYFETREQAAIELGWTEIPITKRPAPKPLATPRSRSHHPLVQDKIPRLSSEIIARARTLLHDNQAPASRITQLAAEFDISYNWARALYKRAGGELTQGGTRTDHGAMAKRKKRAAALLAAGKSNREAARILAREMRCSLSAALTTVLRLEREKPFAIGGEP